MKVFPYNNRILIEEIKKQDQSKGGIVIPDFVKERGNLDRFLLCRIIDASADIKNRLALINAKCIVETGMIEEVVIDKQKYMFCPYNYIVCLLSDEDAH